MSEFFWEQRYKERLDKMAASLGRQREKEVVDPITGEYVSVDQLAHNFANVKTKNNL